MPKRRLSSAQARRMARRRWARRWAGAGPSVLTDDAIREVMRRAAQATLEEAAASTVLVAAELGLDRATAERLAAMTVLLTIAAIEDRGGPSLDVPDGWRETVAWATIYDAAGRSLVAGAMARESAEVAEA